jgi:hypothetical protein
MIHRVRPQKSADGARHGASNDVAQVQFVVDHFVAHCCSKFKFGAMVWTFSTFAP